MNLSLLIQTIILSALPISELRGSIPIIILSNSNYWFFYVILAILTNIAIIPFIFYFLDHFHIFLTRFKTYNKIFDKLIKRTRRKIEKRVGTKWELLTLYFLVAIPLPFTGAYTGILAAWFFKLNRKKAIKSIIYGVITAGIIVTILSLFFSYLF